jgi:hypothetical protein
MGPGHGFLLDRRLKLRGQARRAYPVFAAAPTALAGESSRIEERYRSIQ